MSNMKKIDEKDVLRKELAPSKRTVEESKPSNDANITKLTMLKCYKRIDKKVRDLFLGEENIEGEFASLDVALQTKAELPSPLLGTKLIHKHIIDYFVPPENMSEEDRKGVEVLVETLKIVFPNIEIQKGLRLNGYMTSIAANPQHCYYWSGIVDAIAWYENQYVIVDWEVMDELDFLKDPKPYREYFWQCLVYARLLQLHWKLDELPYILIVPISSFTRKEIHPIFFKKYPDEYLKKLKEYDWSETDPNESSESNVQNEKIIEVPCVNLFKDECIGEVNLDQKLTSMLRPNATVRDLLETFNMPGFKLVENKNPLIETAKAATPP